MDAHDALWNSARARALIAAKDIGATFRLARQARRWRQADVGRAAGYSASTISRLETGRRAGADLDVLRRVAHVVGIPPGVLGALTGLTPAVPATVAKTTGPQAEEDDPVRRRQLLANLAVTAAATAGVSLAGNGLVAGEVNAGELLIARVRDAMLGLNPQPADCSLDRLRAGLAATLTDFHHCRYGRLAVRLPRLISGGHAAATAGEDPAVSAFLAEVYTLVTRMLIKLDDAQLGWLAADRARTIAGAADSPLIAAEAARNLAVLARKAGWHSQAMTIALTAADRIELRQGGPVCTAERGLLIQSAAYSAAKSGDRSTMRELTDEAAVIATRLNNATLLRDHGGGFTPATVELHRISAEYSLGEVGAALTAARRIAPASLPTLERRARYFADIAQAYGQCGRRTQCIDALLAAERQAPEEIHARPAIRALVSGLLVSGPTTPQLRGLASRCGLA
jgi:transcriptional regulator with XRE-family HTH domain